MTLLYLRQIDLTTLQSDKTDFTFLCLRLVNTKTLSQGLTARSGVDS
jgi:hypothetical protein